MERNALTADGETNRLFQRRWFLFLLVFLVVAAIYLGCVVSPPSLMDDVDAVQAVIARNMLTSGDWVTASSLGERLGLRPEKQGAGKAPTLHTQARCLRYGRRLDARATTSALPPAQLPLMIT